MSRLLLVAAFAVCASAFELYPTRPVPFGWTATNKAVNLDESIILTIGLQRRNMDQMDKIFWQVSTPTDPKYGEHLDHEKMTKLIAPHQASVEKVVAWLKSTGATDFVISRHQDYVKVTTTMRVVQRLLHVRFQTYRHTTGKEASRALGAVTIPDSLKSIVEVIGGHGGFPLVKSTKVIHPRVKNVASPQTNVTPALIYQVYNFTEFPATPAGQTNVQSFFQAQGQFVNTPDLQQFCAEMLTGADAIAACNITHWVGPNPPEEAGLESSLDSEYILATSHGQKTWVYSYTSFDFCGDLMQWAMDVYSESSGEFPHVISMSYGSQQLPNYCLGPDVERLNRDTQKMGAMGITVVIASGDDGSGEDNRQSGYNGGLLGASFPASLQYVTAVGSTTFVAGNAGQQMASSAFGSGGGFSFDYPALAYQLPAIQGYFGNATSTKTLLPPALSYNSSGRATPDVSFFGENFWVVSEGEWQQVDGTSCSTPSFAGIVTLLNNVRLIKGKVLGFINPLLYAHPEVFTDIVLGNNDVNADGYGWYAAPGWDPATGLGTPNVGRMIDLVKSL